MHEFRSSGNAKAHARKCGRKDLLGDPTYKPGALVDFAIAHLGARSDAGLARATGISAATWSNVRCRRLPIGDAILIKLHEQLGVTTLELKQIAGIPA